MVERVRFFIESLDAWAHLKQFVNWARHCNSLCAPCEDAFCTVTQLLTEGLLRRHWVGSFCVAGITTVLGRGTSFTPSHLQLWLCVGSGLWGGWKDVRFGGAGADWRGTYVLSGTLSPVTAWFLCKELTEGSHSAKAGGGGAESC